MKEFIENQRQGKNIDFKAVRNSLPECKTRNLTLSPPQKSSVMGSKK